MNENQKNTLMELIDDFGNARESQAIADECDGYGEWVSAKRDVERARERIKTFIDNC
jgi:hypothetical protein